MNNIEYIGEHLFPGQLGNFFVILAFVAAFLSCISYYFVASEITNSDSWQKIARTAFYIHALSLI